MQRCCIVNKYWSEVWKQLSKWHNWLKPRLEKLSECYQQGSQAVLFMSAILFFICSCWRVMRICHRSYCFTRHSVYIVPLCYMIWHSSEFDKPWVYLPFKTSVRVCSVCVIATDHSCCQRAWTRSKTSLGLPSVETHSSNTFHSLPTFQKIKSVFNVGKIV